MENNAVSMSNLSRFTGLAAILSILACYGTLAFVTIMSIFGVTIKIHGGVWAGVITLFAWLVVLSIAINYRYLRANGPLMLAVVGAAIITVVMFVTFNRFLEITGFAALIASSLWERRVKRCAKQDATLDDARELDTV
jgi:hypothetical protein